MSKQVKGAWIVCCIGILTALQSGAQTITNNSVLRSTGTAVKILERNNHQQLLKLSAEKNWPFKKKGLNGGIAYLTGIDPKGYPLYTAVNNNIISASTIGVNLLWPGANGLNLSGSSAYMNNKLGLWDLGQVRATHVELAGRITQKESSTTEDHTTHVAGTMIAKGVNPAAKGMAYEAAKLICYDFSNHLSEMLSESQNLLVSNHSYSNIAGWYYNTDEERWEFWGENGAAEDYKFGYYSYDAQLFDSIAYNAPYYLIVKAAGNSRSENGPAVGETYWRFNAGGTMINAGPRPQGINSNDEYDNIPTYGVAKNILTIGAVLPIPNGYKQTQDVKGTSFSSWGPTDDGRIKPDVVADGVNVLSSTAASDNAYTSYSGTSMATPAASGSAFLLQEYYARLNSGSFLRSATLKGLIIHTADEAGTTEGPDYQYGWGLMNMRKAADVISGVNNDHLIYEKLLSDQGPNAEFNIHLVPSGAGPITATLCWTDPKGRVESVNVLNNQASKLVNDLDMRISIGGQTYFPWKLDPANPSLAATKGDNTRDNVEKIVINNPVAGAAYALKISHKRSLDRASQAFSLIVSGVKILTDNTPNTALIVVSPNPAPGAFNIQFVTAEPEEVSISLFNTIGQQVYAKSYPGFSGQFIQQVYVGHLSKGLYFLKIMRNKKEEIRRIIVR
ncbi:MAG: S8 family serine peptidase [Chitinophagaceae bacterium]|nr:S8 family serine peptidase [Chitinophagaceae bacterium]